MYPVSDGFLRAVKSNTRKYYWTGTIVTKGGMTYEFGAKEIVKGSGYISRQCCGSTEIELGTVYAAEMGITLLSDIDRYTLEDAQVTLVFHLVLADGLVEEVPMGVFEVSEANRLAKCLELKAYDFMLRFDKSFNGFETVGTAYDFIALCCKRCKVEFANKRAEIEAMPNGGVTLSVYTENDIETCRDVLFYVAQVLGGFFIINREGKLELRKYGKDPVMKVEQRHRFSSSFSDFITRYTAVSSTNKQTQIAEYYALDPDNGLTMNLGVNPLLQFGLKETREMLCRNILADLSVIRYVPFDSDTIGNPALDPGDVLTFAGGQADEGQITCITSIRQRIGIHTFTNASVHEIGQTKQMTLFEAVELDFEKDLLYSITFGTSSVTITKIRIPVFNIGLNEKLDDTTYTVLEEQTLTTESFTFLGDYTKYGSYPERNVKCCVRKGYLYVPSYDKKGVYKINTANSADLY